MVVGAALAQQFEPQVGQAGKDVVWVPTPQALVDRMLDMANVKPGDFLMDLGSGDGRTVITAAKRGVRALGVEYNPKMVELSRANAKKAGVGELATFQQGDLFEADLSKATVITLFLLPDINLRLRPKILELKPGTRVVSNSFDMGDWEADQTVQASENCTSWCRAHFWLVPAKVEGTWKLPDGGQLSLQQKYQIISGTLRNGHYTMPIVNGKVTADVISFNAGTSQFTGRVDGNAIDGVSQTTTGWKATRGK
jgi:SAM-dependent methyltransferase